MSPWIKRVPKPHECNKPNLDSWMRKPRAGERWQCRKCKKVFEVMETRGYLRWSGGLS